MKAILGFILSIIDTKALLNIVLEVLEKKAGKTENKIDDRLIELVKQYKDKIGKELDRIDNKLNEKDK